MRLTWRLRCCSRELRLLLMATPTPPRLSPDCATSSLDSGPPARGEKRSGDRLKLSSQRRRLSSCAWCDQCDTTRINTSIRSTQTQPIQTLCSSDKCSFSKASVTTCA